MAKNKVIFAGEVLIDLTGDTVTPSDLAYGVTAHDNSGEIITGTSTKDADTSDANAVVAEILAGKTAYVNGNKLTGTMVNNGSVTGSISDKDDEYTIPIGYHDGSGKVAIDTTEAAKIIPENIKSGVEMLGVIGSYSGESINVQSKTVTPTKLAQTVLPDAGYDYISQVTVNGIPYVESANAYGTTVTIG